MATFSSYAKSMGDEAAMSSRGELRQEYMLKYKVWQDSKKDAMKNTTSVLEEQWSEGQVAEKLPMTKNQIVRDLGQEVWDNWESAGVLDDIREPDVLTGSTKDERCTSSSHASASKTSLRAEAWKETRQS